MHKPIPSVAGAFRSTLHSAASALHAFIDATDTDEASYAIDRAVQLLSACSCIVITGMGKSGCIAAKAASTFRSLGHPAIFLHPAEASHGDMGMLAQGAVVLALSNSGETRELADLLRYCTECTIPVIAVTSSTRSTLADHSTIVIEYGPVSEAGHLPAPTTSTSLAMAICDALAVALSRHEGVTVEDFYRHHPAGELGRNLRRVRDVMRRGREAPLIAHDCPIMEAIAEITAKSLGIGVVMAGTKVVGVVTDGDIRRHARTLAGGTVGYDPVVTIMSSDFKVARADEYAVDVAARMTEQAVTSLVVLNDVGMFEGVVHIHDCMR